MVGTIGLFAVFMSAVLIAVADAYIKQIASGTTFLSALLNPWMLLVCALYFLQILLAIYVFVHKGNLSIYGNLYIVFYSVLVVVLGVVIFKEQLSVVQILGVILALCGALLLNSSL